jgi:hypothetical protein
MEQAVISIDGQTFGKTYIPDEFTEKFAELIVRECVKECKQEWYDLNAESVADDDPFRDPRATGIRVGQKAGVLKCISKIKQHFGVEE